MRPSKIILTISFLTIVLSTLNISNAIAQNHKCKGADGKVEYSDRPCVAEKVASSTSSVASNDKPVSPLIEKLNLLFAEYEDRLCQRERLSNETDRAARSGTLHLPEWSAKEAKLRDLNEDLVQFQGKASKFTSGKASDSEETMAVRQFQIKVRKCGKLSS
jgi:hypothetical protein